MPSDAESLVIAQTVHGVLVLEIGSAGGVQPLGKEPAQTLAGLRFGDLAEVIRVGRLPGELGGEGAHGLVENVVADDPAQHVQNHSPFVRGQRLEFRGEDVQLAATAQRHGVIGQRTHGHVFGDFLEPGFTGSLLDITRLGVAGETVAQPEALAVGWAHQRPPPLVGDRVGQQPVIDFSLEGARGQCRHLRRPGRGRGVIGQFNDLQSG